MKTPTSADALRVARTLLGYSQRAAAEAAGLKQKAVMLAEAPSNVGLETNLNLVAFYEKQCIEFLGDLAVGKEIRRAGARWKLPKKLPPSAKQALGFHAHSTGVHFRAARSLVGLERGSVAEDVKISVTTIEVLERGVIWAASFDLLRKYYTDKGVEFVGWGDVSTNVYYGVGVRWIGAAQSQRTDSGKHESVDHDNPPIALEGQ